MAPTPSYNNLAEGDFNEDGEEEIDFSDLNAQYEVRLEEGLDTFVVVDGLPIVTEDQKQKLVRYVMKTKFNTVGKTTEEQVFMPMVDGKSEGYAFVEYQTPEQAATAAKTLNGTNVDKKHVIAVNKLTDIEKYGREGRINEEYVAPEIEPFKEREHLRAWLGDEEGRDQFLMYASDLVGVYWNEREETPDTVVERPHWTESFMAWSPMGTYLTSLHVKGVLLWGGTNWNRLKRFTHPGVNLVDFSPNENYLTTWSHRPITVDEDNPSLTAEEEGKNYIIWDIATGKPLRSFANIDSGPTVDEAGNPIKKKMQWPAFKWSADDKYVARLTQGQSVSVYELPRMNLLDRTSVKIEGVQDFEWAPATTTRDGTRAYEQLFCFWTPELGSNPARVGLMSIPSKEIVRTRNLFNVSDAKLHWQSQAQYVCVKVDRHSKSKKSLATNLEIFRVREKGVPVEVIDTIKDPVINFAWEPKGDRFVFITAGEAVMNSAVPPKTSVSFYAPEKTRTQFAGNFRHVKTLEKRNSNGIYWSPKGRFVIVATVQSAQSSELDFWDMDFEGEKEEAQKAAEKELAANLQLMTTAEHYGVTDVEWDPSGRFVATSASMWKHALENGYHIYSSVGTMLREQQVDRFKQFAWRPRPPTLLSKDEQKNIRKNLREYSKVFDEADIARKTTANREVIERRRRMMEEWMEWRGDAVRDLREAKDDMGLEEDDETQGGAKSGGEKVVEEIVEEIIKEEEEVV